MIITNIRTLFIAEATITNIVGTTGVYVDEAEQGVMPHVLLTVISHDPLAAHDGHGTTLMATDIDVDCKSTRVSEANSLADAIETYFNDFTGTAGTDTIRGVLLNDRSSGRVPPTEGTQTGRFIVTLDYRVFWAD